MFIAPLLIIDKIWKLLGCSAAGELINYRQKTEHYSPHTKEVSYQAVKTLGGYLNACH